MLRQDLDKEKLPASAMEPGTFVKETFFVDNEEVTVAWPVFGPRTITEAERSAAARRKTDEYLASKADKEAADNAAWAAAEAAQERAKARLAARRRVKRKGM